MALLTVTLVFGPLEKKAELHADYPLPRIGETIEMSGWPTMGEQRSLKVMNVNHFFELGKALPYLTIELGEME